MDQKKIRELIIKLNEIEVEIKKNNSISLILMKNFVYEILNKDVNSSSL